MTTQTPILPGDPLAGPFMTGLQMCDYSNEEGYAIPAGSGTAAPSRARLLREAAIGR